MAPVSQASYAQTIEDYADSGKAWMKDGCGRAPRGRSLRNVICACIGWNTRTYTRCVTGLYVLMYMCV